MAQFGETAVRATSRALCGSARPMLSLHFGFRLAALGVVGALALVVWSMVLRGDVRRAIPLVILSWAVSDSYFVGPRLTYYTDANGVTNYLGIGSLLLFVVFLGLVVRDGRFTTRFLRTPTFAAFYVLFACAVVTQGWHLGLVPGIGLAYARVLQPMMVVALLAYMGRDQAGLRRACLWIIGAVALAIGLRYTAGAALGQASVSGLVENAGGGQRVAAIGSWTIYGTICASTLPLLVAVFVIDHSRVERVALTVVALITVKEVLATGTRGAVLGFSALLLFLLRRGARWWVVALVGVALTGAIVFGFQGEFSGTRALSFNVGGLLSQANTRARLERNRAAIHFIAESPVSGAGLGIPLQVDGNQIGSWVYNPYLAWGVAMGLLALLAFASIVGLSAVYAVTNWRAATGSLRTLRVGLVACLAVWLVNQFTTGDSLTYLQSTQASYFFYAVVGLILGSRLAESSRLSRARAGLV